MFFDVAMAQNEWIRRNVVRLGRYPDARPAQGFDVDRDNCFLLTNLMEVWGHRNGVSAEEVLDAIRSGMYQTGTRHLRFSISTDLGGNTIIRVYPKMQDHQFDTRISSNPDRGRSRSPRPKRMPRADSRHRRQLHGGRNRSPRPKRMPTADNTIRGRETTGSSVRSVRSPSHAQPSIDRAGISKALAKVLRHKAEKFGISIDSAGWCPIQQVLRTHRLRRLNCTLEMLRIVVDRDRKERYQIQCGQIRAVQGHSMNSVESEHAMERMWFTDEDLPRECIHGTYQYHRRSIEQRGLLAGGLRNDRNHIHFIASLPGRGRVKSGMRDDCDLAVFIDLPRALEDGIPFFRSANDVILSPGVDGVIAAHYIIQVRSL